MGIILPLLLLLNIYFIRNKNEFLRNSPESARLRFHCRPRNRGKGALQVADNFTIDYLLCVEYRVPNMYFYVENILRAIQTKIIFNPAVV